MKQKNIKGLISEYFIFLIFIALVVVLTCLKPSFIAPTNLVNILKQASINGILAFGMMFVIIAGGFDMSVGSTVAFTGILAALLGKGDLPLIVPLVVAMLAGLAVGMVNGIGVAIGDLPPFIMTLGSMTAVRGLALLTSNGKPITGISKEYKAVASLCRHPDAVRLSCNRYHHLCICFIKTVYGRRVYACGGNLQAARVSASTHCHPHFHVRHCRPAGWSCGFLMTSALPSASDRS
ncbi:MAG: ABC transporter permease [Butyricicoccus sp.]